MLSHVLANGRSSTDCRSERKLYALKNWISTSERKVRVIASVKLRPAFSAQTNRPRLTTVDQRPPAMMRVTTGRVKMPVLGSRGGRFMRSDSGGSTARSWAGRTSVTRLTYRSCTALSGNGSPAKAAPAIRNISPTLDESRYIRYFLMLPKTPRPSSDRKSVDEG